MESLLIHLSKIGFLSNPQINDILSLRINRDTKEKLLLLKNYFSKKKVSQVKQHQAAILTIYISNLIINEPFFIEDLCLRLVNTFSDKVVEDKLLSCVQIEKIFQTSVKIQNMSIMIKLLKKKKTFSLFKSKYKRNISIKKKIYEKNKLYTQDNKNTNVGNSELNCNNKRQNTNTNREKSFSPNKTHDNDNNYDALNTLNSNNSVNNHYKKNDISLTKSVNFPTYNELFKNSRNRDNITSKENTSTNQKKSMSGSIRLNTTCNNTNAYSNKSFYERQLTYKKNKEHKIKKMRLEKEQCSSKEHSFKPALMINKYDGYEFDTLNNINKLDLKSYYNRLNTNIHTDENDYKNKYYIKSVHDALFEDSRINKYKKIMLYASTRTNEKQINENSKIILTTGNTREEYLFDEKRIAKDSQIKYSQVPSHSINNNSIETLSDLVTSTRNNYLSQLRNNHPIKYKNFD